MREHIVRDGVGELLGSFARDTVFEVVVSRNTRTGNCLIGGIYDTFDAESVVQRFESDNCLNGRAVGVGDDAFIPFDVFGVDFGNDEGNVFVHTPLAAVVDNDRARFDEYGSELFGRACACGEQCEIYFARESHNVFFGELDDGVGLAHEIDLFTRASCGCEQVIILDGKLSFREYFEELVAYHTGSADHGDVELFHKTSRFAPYCREYIVTLVKCQ